eukprot:FR740574.1.p1 GENE.FR740574.1~~FR740574.1.p1  ORF type:complete len:202 (+),score=40.04 FR740574.1:49-606(+)
MPAIDGNILVSIAKSDQVAEGQDARHEFLPQMKLMEEIGLTLYGTPGTADYYSRMGIKVKALAKPQDDVSASDSAAMTEAGGRSSVVQMDLEQDADAKLPITKVVEFIKSGALDLVINVPEGSRKEEIVSNGYMIRRTTVDFGISLITNIKVAKLFVEAFAKKKAGNLPMPMKTIQEYYDDDKLL